MRRLLLSVVSLLLLVSCGTGTINADFDLPANAVLLRVHPANMALRHWPGACPAAVVPTLGNFSNLPPVDGGQVAWKLFPNLEPGAHCFYLPEQDAADINVEPFALELFINADEYTAPEEAWAVAYPVTP